MRKRIKKRNKGILLILTLIFSFSIFYLFLFNFRTIEIEPQSLAGFLNNYFKKKSPIFIYKDIKKIIADFPEILKIEISQNIFKRKLYLKIKTSEIIAKICDLKKCFYLDNFAQIIEPGIKPQEKLFLIQSFPEIERNSLLNPILKNFFLYLFEFANYYSLPLNKIKIYSNFDIGVFDEKDREFLFDPRGDSVEQIKKFYIFLEKFKNSPAKRIDLRIKQKIYFK